MIIYTQTSFLVELIEKTKLLQVINCKTNEIQLAIFRIFLFLHLKIDKNFRLMFSVLKMSLTNPFLVKEHKEWRALEVNLIWEQRRYDQAE